MTFCFIIMIFLSSGDPHFLEKCWKMSDCVNWHEKSFMALRKTEASVSETWSLISYSYKSREIKPSIRGYNCHSQLRKGIELFNVWKLMFQTTYWQTLQKFVAVYFVLLLRPVSELPSFKPLFRLCRKYYIIRWCSKR